MRVILHIRLESVPDEPPVWWADSPEVPGLYAANTSLAALQDEAAAAAIDALTDEGVDPDDIEIMPCLVDADGVESPLSFEVSQTEDQPVPSPGVPVQSFERVLVGA
jgi:hypothetical protein